VVLGTSREVKGGAEGKGDKGLSEGERSRTGPSGLYEGTGGRSECKTSVLILGLNW